MAPHIPFGCGFKATGRDVAIELEAIPLVLRILYKRGVSQLGYARQSSVFAAGKCSKPGMKQLLASPAPRLGLPAPRWSQEPFANQLEASTAA